MFLTLTFKHRALHVIFDMTVAEEQKELMRKEIMDLKRAVNDEVREKETVSKIADELRGNVKRIEGEKTEFNRGLMDAKQRICSKYKKDKVMC